MVKIRPEFVSYKMGLLKVKSESYVSHIAFLICGYSLYLAHDSSKYHAALNRKGPYNIKL